LIKGGKEDTSAGNEEREIREKRERRARGERRAK
jgi:hypothetical protein